MEQAGWQAAMEDPFRAELLKAGKDLPERVRRCAAPLQDAPAFDPAFMDRLAGQMQLPAKARFEHPLLERAVRVGLAHVEATFQGDHPKYGVGFYARPEHDAFPPTIIATVDALTLWGMTERAERLFGYWLDHFIRHDGTIDYYGPSLSEYGQLLTSARRLMERGGSGDWLKRHAATLLMLAARLREWMRAGGQISLLKGAPEADTREDAATYFHNNAWVVRGLRDCAFLVKRHVGREEARPFEEDAARLHRLLPDAIRDTWPRDPNDWWLRPMVEPDGEGTFARPQGRITAGRLGSYTNYRYWPELLSSGVLSRDLMRRVVAARLAGGGQFCGMTRFEDHLDDWPLMEHMEGLWTLGMRQDYRLCLWGHICYHQAEGHLTAYEQVSFPPGRKRADYCLPCQLVTVRAARRLV
jgi:hypothetical protein